MKKYLLALPLVSAGVTIANNVFATSTVILDPPDIATGINQAYEVAQPLMNSVSGWLWIIIGILFVGGVIAIVLNAISSFFRR